MSHSTAFPRKVRAVLALVAVALAALFVAQPASAEPTTVVPTPTHLAVQVTTDQTLADTLSGVPGAAMPGVLAAVGQAFDVTVTLTDDAGAPAAFDADQVVVLGPSGVTTAPGTTSVISAGASTATFSAVYGSATNSLAVTASIAATDTTPLLTATAEPFAVNLTLQVFENGQDPALRSGTLGSDADGCRVVDATHPMCALVSLPGGVTGGAALTLGLCPEADATCRPGALVTQFLGDLESVGTYSRTAPASMTILCDKTLCGSGGVAGYRAQWSESASGPLSLAPACPAKGVIGADQTYCTDFVASSRMNAGDLKLVVLFLHDVRGMI